MDCIPSCVNYKIEFHEGKNVKPLWRYACITKNVSCFFYARQKLINRPYTKGTHDGISSRSVVLRPRIQHTTTILWTFYAAKSFFCSRKNTIILCFLATFQ